MNGGWGPPTDWKGIGIAALYCSAACPSAIGGRPYPNDIAICSLPLIDIELAALTAPVGTAPAEDAESKFDDSALAFVAATFELLANASDAVEGPIPKSPHSLARGLDCTVNER